MLLPNTAPVASSQFIVFNWNLASDDFLHRGILSTYAPADSPPDRSAHHALRPDDWRRPWDGWPGTRYEAKAMVNGVLIAEAEVGDDVLGDDPVAAWEAAVTASMAKRTGRTVEEYVSFVDFAPTFVEVAGLSPSFG